MKRILFFTYDFPYPANTGGKNRAYNMIKFSKNKDVRFFLASFVREDFQKKQQEELKKIGVEKIKIFKRNKISKFQILQSSFFSSDSVFKRLYFNKSVEEQLINFVKKEKVDTIIYESLWTAFYINSYFTSLGVRQIFGTENIEYRVLQDSVNYSLSPFLRYFYLLQSKKVKKEEETLFKKADICLAVTENEAKFIKNISGKECFVIENGVDTSYFRFAPKKKITSSNILFVGNFSYFPNIDAVRFFYNEVFSQINDENFKFIVVGKKANKLAFIKDHRVEKIEYVPDIRLKYQEADIFVFPVRLGGGTNFKILEAMAIGVPVVAFPNRIDELGLVKNAHVLVSKDKTSFFKNINLLLNNLNLRILLVKSARKFVEKNYSWEEIGKKMQKIWQII